ncbi:MAG: hypothetical protein E6Q58_03130 [Niabella sp.]|nr:MAG: hypothetical protein E6Q58_03130 [Niabella sp.]
MPVEEIHYLNANTAFLKRHSLVVALEKPSMEPYTPVKKDPKTDVAKWGDNNDFPQQIIKLASESTELASLLDWKARALQGTAVLAVESVWNETRQEFEDKLINDEEITGFLRSIHFKRYLREASTDFFWFWNVFPELIKNEAGDKIAYLGVQDASYCRWSPMNERGIIEHCYISANWPNAKISDLATLKLPVIDPYSPNAIEELRGSEIQHFIYPVSYPSPGKSYYQLAPWDGWRTSGWPELAKMIPKSKVQLMKQLLSAKFILEIPVNYWPTAYPEWPKMTLEEQMTIKRAKVKEINDTITGVENTGKTILSESGTDAMHQPIQGWKILPIEDKLKDGNFLEDSREASQHLRSALALDSALTGDGPGKGMGGGSGSDKRIALNIYVALQQPYREIILEPLYFIAAYNGWTNKDRYPSLKFKTVEIQLETLDKAHETSTFKST